MICNYSYNEIFFQLSVTACQKVADQKISAVYTFFMISPQYTMKTSRKVSGITDRISDSFLKMWKMLWGCRCRKAGN